MNPYPPSTNEGQDGGDARHINPPIITQYAKPKRRGHALVAAPVRGLGTPDPSTRQASRGTRDASPMNSDPHRRMKVRTGVTLNASIRRSSRRNAKPKRRGHALVAAPVRGGVRQTHQRARRRAVCRDARIGCSQFGPDRAAVIPSEARNLRRGARCPARWCAWRTPPPHRGSHEGVPLRVRCCLACCAAAG